MCAGSVDQHDRVHCGVSVVLINQPATFQIKLCGQVIYHMLSSALSVNSGRTRWITGAANYSASLVYKTLVWG